MQERANRSDTPLTRPVLRTFPANGSDNGWS